MSRFGITLVGGDYLEDASKAQRELGWRPQVPMREAVRRTLQWRRSARSRAVVG